MIPCQIPPFCIIFLGHFPSRGFLLWLALQDLGNNYHSPRYQIQRQNNAKKRRVRHHLSFKNKKMLFSTTPPSNMGTPNYRVGSHNGIPMIHVDESVPTLMLKTELRFLCIWKDTKGRRRRKWTLSE